MSDDFSICPECGCFEPSTENPMDTIKELKDDMIDALNEYDFATFLSYIDELKEMIIHYENGESKCLECNNWVVLAWKHVEYNK